MHVRIRIFGKPDSIVVVESKLTKIEQFRKIIKDKFDVQPKLQRLFYGGKLLENGYTFHDYNIRLNDVIQLMVRSQLEDAPKAVVDTQSKETPNASEDIIEYKDAESKFYAINDLIDMRDREQGAWFEGKIVRIVYNPEVLPVPEIVVVPEDKSKNSLEQKGSSSSDKESDVENKPPPITESKESPSKIKKKGIAKYFSKSPVSKKKQLAVENNCPNTETNEENLLFKVQLDADEEDSNLYCKLKEIRPRARNVITVKSLKPGQTVMLNHNTDNSSEKGFWYDFKVSEVIKLRVSYELVGTLYLGPEAVPQNDTKIKVLDKIYAIEEVVPLDLRTQEYKDMLNAEVEKRTQPLNCLTCRDDEETPCKDCGCYLCLGKELPEKIVLCDECNNGYHMYCLTPTLTVLPEEDWYCPTCKRDPNDVIAPGAAKQTKKTPASKSTRDWGRGMACVGKTKTCAMPANHFGPIPGIEVGMCWRFRIQLSESGVHRPPVSGIHGRDVEGAYSIVLSGGYEDDVDNGEEFTYTGSGGRDLSGNKRTAEQSCDQTLTRENKALARNCSVKSISEQGGDAGDNWREGRPVRVVRSYKMLKHFPKYAPKEGIRYDGIYKVVKYYPEKGLSGFRVWKYLLRRDDPCPAPWEPEAKQFPIVYPDGYLEAEAEKRALKEKNAKNKNNNRGKKKRALRESNDSSDSDCEVSPPVKKRKTTKKDTDTKTKGKKGKSPPESPKVKISDMFTKSPKAKSPKAKVAAEKADKVLTEGELGEIKSDTLNEKLWGECLQVCEVRGRKYPDGYLEAEAEKRALKEKNAKNKNNNRGKKKRALRESNDSSDSDCEVSPPVKKRKTTKKDTDTKTKGKKGKSPPESPKVKIPDMFTKSPKAKSPKAKVAAEKADKVLTEGELGEIKSDTLNEKLWGECLQVCEVRGRKEFVEYLTQMFLCIICQELAVNPVTTPCSHNFCMACIKLAFKSSGGQSCPCCRNNLAKYDPQGNDNLKRALRAILPGYDAGKK